MKYLVFEVITEHEYLTAAVKWTRELAQVILARHTVVEGLSEEDPSIKSVAYLGNAELYEAHPNFDDHVCKDGDGGPWYLFDDGFPSGDEIRLIDISLIITKYGEFYWAMIPKHSSDVIETPGVSIGQLHGKGMLDEDSFGTEKEEE